MEEDSLVGGGMRGEGIPGRRIGMGKERGLPTKGRRGYVSFKETAERKKGKDTLERENGSKVTMGED